jgi:hypothetical protein
MKKRIFISLALFAILAVAPVFSQEKYESVTAAVKFEKIKIPVSKNGAFQAAFFKPLLTESGTVGFNAQNQTFVFNDTPARIEFIKKFAGVLENSEFQSKDFFAKPKKGRRGVTETVPVGLLTIRIGCDVGEEFAYAGRQVKLDLLIKTITEIKVRAEIVGIDMNYRGLKLTGTRKRVELAKKIIALFEQNDLDQINQPLG